MRFSWSEGSFKLHLGPLNFFFRFSLDYKGMNSVKTVPKERQETTCPWIPKETRHHSATQSIFSWRHRRRRASASSGTCFLRSLQIFKLVTVFKVLLEHFFYIPTRVFHKAHVESLVNIFRLNVNNSPQRLMRFVVWHLVCRRGGGCEFVVQSEDGISWILSRLGSGGNSVQGSR